MSDSVRHLFPQLFANGYVPLPNYDKACKIPRWPVIDVNAEQCRRWTRQTRWTAIGLRVEAPLLVLDLDLKHPKVAAAMRAALPAWMLEQALERVGEPPKTAFFMRLSAEDTAFRELHSHVYRLEECKLAIQAFGGGMPHPQVGAFGPHSHDKAGGVLRRYTWLTKSPAEVPIHELPEISKAEVEALLMAFEEMMAAWPGAVRDETSHKGAEGDFQDAYDITEATIFHDPAGEAYTYAELIERAQALRRLKQPEMRVTASFTHDPNSKGSGRAKVHWNERTGLAIVDFATGITHRPIIATEEPEIKELLGSIRRTK